MPPPITPEHNVHDVPGETQLTQDMEHVHFTDETPKWRGLEQVPSWLEPRSDCLHYCGFTAIT